jgi:hypothetical protein
MNPLLVGRYPSAVVAEGTTLAMVSVAEKGADLTGSVVEVDDTDI